MIVNIKAGQFERLQKTLRSAVKGVNLEQVKQML